MSQNIGQAEQVAAAAATADSRPKAPVDGTTATVQVVGTKGAQQYALSRLRWPLLMAVATFGYCNGIADEHAVILNVYVQSLDIELADYINLCQVFFFVPFVGSFLAANLVDNCGLKLTLYVTLLMACVRNGARILLFTPNLSGWHQFRLVYWLLMRGLTQMNSAFYFCLPLKLSESWFPESERSFAWSISSSAPILGIASASLLVPHLVRDLTTCHWIAWYNGAGLVISVLAIGLGVRRSEPAEGPPSLRNELTRKHKLAEASGQKVDNIREIDQVDDQLNSTGKRLSAPVLFCRQVLRVIKNGDLLIQLLVYGTFGQLLSVIVMVLQDIFKGAGLSAVFTGQFLAFQIFVAFLVEVLVASRLKPKGTPEDPYNTRICKLLVLGMLITFVLFAMSLVVHELEMFEIYTNWFEQHQWLLVTFCCLSFEVARNCAKPFLTEQTAELIYGVVSEANSTAFRSAISSIVFNVSAFTFVRLRQTHRADLTAADQVDELEAIGTSTMRPLVDGLVLGRPLYLRPILFVCFIALLITLIYLIKFDPNAKRRREREAQRAQHVSGRQIVEMSKL